jgi:ER-bound oxygenase mpaB/B'/Rubber oxygenase, catalytic domain
VGVARDEILQEIRRLDPVDDHQRIAFLTSLHEFPWDTTRSLELALFRAFAVAKGTTLLAGTGEFTARTQKRYDDTVLILAEILEHGYDSDRGKAALRRMNQMHGRYAIPNDEFLYVLSTFVFEPIRWNERFGWRPLLQKEKLASFEFWRQIARRMAITDLPEDYAAFERYYDDFARQHYRFAPENRALAVATRDLFLGWYLPKALWPIGRPLVHAMMDDDLLAAVGLPRPHPIVRRAVEGAVRLRGRIVRRMPPRRTPRLITQQRHPTYPRGYRIEELGVH